MPVWGFLLSLVTAACWAVSPILMKIGMKRAGPNEVNPIRSFGFLATMIVVMIITQPGRWPSVTPFMVFALLINVGTSAVLGDQLYIYSINKIGASLAVSINSSYPLITAIVSILVLDEKITPLIWGGTLSVIIGLLVITLGSRKKKSGEESNRKEKLAVRTLFIGIALSFASAVCSGANTPFIKALMHKGGWNPIEMYFLRSIAYIVLVWLVRLVEWRKFPHIVMPLRKVRLKAWIAFFVCGCVALALAGILFGVCVNVMPVSVVTPITASSPLVTVLIARFFYKEKLTKAQSAGIAFVVLGSIAVSL
jgi:drug/metabolite transporter (DMT)-like permease